MRAWLWMMAICLVVPAQALDIYAASGGQERFLTLDSDDPRATGSIDEGTAGPDSVTWQMRLDPPRNATWVIDGDAQALVRLGAASGAGSVDVAAILQAGQRTIVTMPSKPLTYTADFATAAWVVPVQLNLSLEEGPLWWNITAEGTFTSIFLDVSGADRSRIDLPVTNMTVPLPPVPTEHRDVTADRLRVKWAPEEPMRRLITYTWAAPRNITGLVQVAADNGTAFARLSSGNATLWEGAWPPSGNETLAWSNMTGDIGLELFFEGFQGRFELVLEAAVEDEAPPPPKKRSPAPLPLLVLVVAWIAARKG